MMAYCLKCDLQVHMINTKNGNPCPQCNKNLKFKCTLCSKTHVTDTYCGMHKHICLHHLSKKNEEVHSKRQSESFANQKSTVNSQVNTVKPSQVNAQKSTLNSQASIQKSSVANHQKLVYNRELVLEDIEKFTILICLHCNDVARVYNGKISDCAKCKMKMTLTCLICSKYESSINSMYEHLHQQHKEHFSDQKVDSTVLPKSQTDSDANQTRIVKKSSCMKCYRRFPSTRTARKHAANCKTQPFLCHHCNFSSCVPSVMKRHYLGRHGKTIETSGLKIKTTSNTSSSVDTAGPKTECQVCGKVILKLESLKNHRKYCGKEPNAKCPYCSYVTKQKSNLNTHINKYHQYDIQKVVPVLKKTEKVLEAEEKFSLHSDKEKPNSIVKANGESSKLNTSIATFKPLKEVAEVICLKCNERKELVAQCKERMCDKCSSILVHRCANCLKSYDLYQSLIYHLDSTCNPKARYECGLPQCNYSTFVANSLYKHLRVHNIDPWALTNNSADKGRKGIPMNFKDNEYIKVIRFRVADPSEVEVAPAKRPRLEARSEDQKLEPQHELPTVECHKCHKMVRNLTKHLQYCGVEATFKCQYFGCSYVTKYNFNVKTHVKNVHKGKIKRNFNVVTNKAKDVLMPEVQDSSSASIKNLRQKDSYHIKAEDLMLSFCPQCDKDAQGTANQKYASKCRVCNLQMTHRCLRCKKETSTREELRIHVRDHWRKPYLCPLCSKTFLYPENLEAHERICAMGRTVPAPVV